METRTEPIRALLVGAGNRGRDAYGRYASSHPWRFKFTAVADPDGARRARFSAEHGIPEGRSHGDWRALLSAASPGDLVFVCTPDRLHFEQASAFIDKGCAVVLEKPVAASVRECAALETMAREGGSRVVVCHVLRYTAFFSTLKALLDEGRVGRLVSIDLQENVGYYHFAHSYVRGNWRSAERSCPVIVAKSCHDLDILHWLAGSRADSVASVGGLAWFRPENAPPGAPARCLEGCPARAACPWYAPALYLTSDEGWPASVISDDPSLRARTRALEDGPYGRCVYRCDNDVVDHQHAVVRFKNGVTASFTLSAFSADISRDIRVTGSAGEIIGNLKEGWLELRDFLSGSRTRVALNAPEAGHSGGDDAMMEDIAAAFEGPQGAWDIRSRIEASIEGHWLAFAAEESRTAGRVVMMDEYRAGVAESLAGERSDGYPHGEP
ncbi:MAG: Gfo/Idh/MocA family oxidoreductase [Spirochaetes bacterium]|nr:Gfo/Idh/MocA family oxidoreductase [Spirochaetota bacterium]MBU1079815.1 Gfo/Idh/MocA family oxidoreductase [Spirochaetota bacterium]